MIYFLQQYHAYINKAMPNKSATLYEVLGVNYIQTTTATRTDIVDLQFNHFPTGYSKRKNALLIFKLQKLSLRIYLLLISVHESFSHMHLYHISASCPQRTEEGFILSRTGIAMSYHIGARNKSGILHYHQVTSELSAILASARNF